MKKKIIQIIFLVLFVVILILPVAFINTNPDAVSYRENRRLQSFPSFDLPWDEFKAQFVSWFNENLGFRDQLLDVRTDIVFKTMGIVSSDLVHKGKDGWYYYKGDNNIQIATGEYLLTNEVLKAILEKHLRIQEKLKAKGIEYVVVLPVSKVSIYPEYMGLDNAKIRRTPVDIVADYLEANSNIKVVRLKQTLLDKKAETQVFFKTDTHWTEEGAYFAYQKIIEDFTNWGLCNTELADVKFIDSYYKGEFSNMLGNINALPEEQTKKAVIENAHAVKDERTQRYNEIESALVSANHKLPWHHYENNNVNNGSVLWYGDSLFGSWNITEELAENYSEFTYVWSYDIDENTVDTVAPNLVVYEMGERYLQFVPSKCSNFAMMPISDFSFELENYRFVGDSYIVELKNTGESVWSELDCIRCQLVVDGNNTGYRAFIPYGIDVKPGDTVQLTFNSIGKVIKEASTVDVQMLQEGLWYYPQKYRIKGVPDESVLFNANYISDDFPQIINANRAYSYSVVMENTGSLDWSENNQIRLGLFVNNCDLGIRAYINNGTVVEPNERYTFIFEDVVVPLDAEITFKMLRENVSYFGEIAVAKTNVVPVKQTVLENVNAELISIYREGENIFVTLKNTGTDIWTENDMIRMCLWQNGDMGARAFIHNNISVAPGEEYTFVFKHAINISEGVSVRLLQEYVMYFDCMWELSI